jgi:hypothetical protein
MTNFIDSDISLNRSPIFGEEQGNLPTRDTSDYPVGAVSIADLNRKPEDTGPRAGKFSFKGLQDAMNGGTDQFKFETDDWNLSNAKQGLTDYILIRLPRRGAVQGTDYTFRFLINPGNIEVSYNTVDAQSLTRSGWNFGVWGDDLIQISMQGKTAGYYFGNGLSEANRIFSQSYRNLLALQKMFENNGFWFEGENNLKVDSSLRRKRIQYHEDVELVYNNFIWAGMFESLSVSSSAETPYLDSFKFSFVAWKERFRSSSPWRDSKHNDIRRGHTRMAWNDYNKHDVKGDPSLGTAPQGWSGGNAGGFTGQLGAPAIGPLPTVPTYNPAVQLFPGAGGFTGKL